MLGSLPSGTPVPLPEMPLPVVAAPMAGGPSTPALAAAVCEAGGLGFLAAGYRSVDDVAEQIGATRALTDRPFGVNVFVPAPAPDEGERLADQMAVEAYADLLASEAARLDIELPQPNWVDTDGWDAKLDLLTDSPVDVVSFTFGLPSSEVVTRLHDVGTSVVATVTDRNEAQAAVAVGADALVVQGFEAGGHRGTHRVADTPNALDHVALLPLLTDLGVPLIAAGGITTSGDTRRALDLGAVAVQAGTAFLLVDEAGTSPAYRDALGDPALASTITRAFSGRPARGLRNRFVDTFDAFAPAVFPVVDQLTKPLRAQAARRGDSGGVSLWAGSGWRAATGGPAAGVVRRLAA